MFLTGRFSAKLKNTVAHLRHFEKRSFERKIEAIHPVQSVIPLKFTGRSRPPVMIGNPFCTLKVFWNFHTKNRLAQVRHAFFDKLARKQPAQILKKRYSKTIKGQKKSLDRLWRYRPSSKAIHETRTEERRHE